MQDVILHGSGEDESTFIYDDGMRRYETTKPFEGVIPNLQRRWQGNRFRRGFARNCNVSRTRSPCEACNGYRLKPQALAVKIARHHIGEVSELSIRQPTTGSATPTKPHEAAEGNRRAHPEGNPRAPEFLNNVGLDYLSLSRASGTLSGGESQRIRLASQIGSGLTGVLYVLDEPSIGLHQRDNAKLLVTLKRLRDLGNTVIVVEHDEDAIRSADHVIDIGPGRRHAWRRDRRRRHARQIMAQPGA